MPLTLRSNGVAGGLVSAAWWNDYYNLFRGIMLDQGVILANTFTIQVPTTDPTTAPTASVVSGTGLGIGLYSYAATYISGDGGESKPTAIGSATTTSGNQKVSLSNLPIGPAGISQRNIYRSKVGGGTLYKLTTIADNTTTTYTDTTADSGLATGSPVPSYSSLGSLMFRDLSGNIRGFMGQDPASGGIVYTNAPAQVISLISNTLMTQVDANGLTIWNQHLNLQGGHIHIQNAGFLGVKRFDGTKLAEFKNNGNMIISGTQYQTSAGSVSTASGQSFDSFDVGEVYECDKVYPNGTVLCPSPDSKLVQCTHDNCPFALVVSHNPGLGLGAPDPNQNHNYVALAGRVNIRCAQDLFPRTLVVSDGRGGVRAVKPGEPAFVLGFTLNETSVIDKSPQVGVFLRSMFVILKGH